MHKVLKFMNIPRLKLKSIIMNMSHEYHNQFNLIMNLKNVTIVRLLFNFVKYIPSKTDITIKYLFLSIIFILYNNFKIIQLVLTKKIMF